MEGDLFGLDLSVLDFDLVSSEDDGDSFANAGQVAVPVGYIFVGDATGDIKHDNGALTLDVVSVAESTELFLSGGVPYIELDGSPVGVEDQGMDLNPEGGDILFLKLSGQVTLDKGGLSHASVSDKDQLELWHLLLSLCVVSKKGDGGLRTSVAVAWYGTI